MNLMISLSLHIRFTSEPYGFPVLSLCITQMEVPNTQTWVAVVRLGVVQGHLSHNLLIITMLISNVLLKSCQIHNIYLV